MEVGYLSEHYNKLLSIIAIFFIGIGVLGITYVLLHNPQQEAQAILCPVDEISTHAEEIFTHLQNYDYDKARAESQNLINLVDKLEQDKIDEDSNDFGMYN